MKEITKYSLVSPTENNRYCIFEEELENNPNILFHITPKNKLDLILSVGFKSADELGTGVLTSVSYAKRSSACLSHLNNNITQDMVAIAVFFTTLDQKGIVINQSDIHVFKDIQPEILGYCVLPKGFTYF